jgi:wyosine [tRNA(Phe)-imidazoG37] synthetase (radical SAM superfamily)
MTSKSQNSTSLRFVYGPVPSRRLGQSLGIDPIPLKTCNWNCVYCQLGRTRPVVNERKEHIPTSAIMDQVAQALTQYEDDEIDWITFVGSGEPVLHKHLGDMIRQIKSETDKPVAVITNGTFLHLAEVRAEIAAADAVLPSLDAGSVDLFRTINRPHPEASFERHVAGLIAFGNEYPGLYWPETMLLHDLNDSEDALNDIATIYGQMRPDKIHINLPNRPPAETWVGPADDEGLMRARAILGAISEVVYPIEGRFDLSGYDNVIDAVLGIITRHPMRSEELERTLADWAPMFVNQALTELQSSGRAQIVERCGARFWSAADSFYPQPDHSKRSSPSTWHD